MPNRYHLTPLAALLAAPHFAQTQTGSVGIGTTAPAASAVSSDERLLLPRVAAAAGSANPALGLMVYQTGLPANFFFRWLRSAFLPVYYTLGTGCTKILLSLLHPRRGAGLAWLRPAAWLLVLALLLPLAGRAQPGGTVTALGTLTTNQTLGGGSYTFTLAAGQSARLEGWGRGNAGSSGSIDGGFGSGGGGGAYATTTVTGPGSYTATVSSYAPSPPAATLPSTRVSTTAGLLVLEALSGNGGAGGLASGCTPTVGAQSGGNGGSPTGTGVDSRGGQGGQGGGPGGGAGGNGGAARNYGGPGQPPGGGGGGGGAGRTLCSPDGIPAPCPAYSGGNGADGQLKITLLPTPGLSSISPNRAMVGATVTLTGFNLTGTTAVTFTGTSNNTVTTGLTVSGTGSNQTITVPVPMGAATGPVTVSTSQGTSNGISFTVGVAPFFTTQPSATNVCQGGTATLSAVASGSPTYQWYSNGSTNSNSGGTAISGATASSANISTSTGGPSYYYVVATNADASTASNAVAITATTTPAPTGAATQTYTAGATVASLVATGTGIQWYATSTGGSPLASTTALTEGLTYYATQTVGGCESQTRLAVSNGGNVGIGTSMPSQKLEVAGTVYSNSGGFMFPDGTVQGTAATTATPQTLALSGQSLSLSGGNAVTLPTQQLSLSGSTLILTTGGSVTLPDASATNELQTISKSGTTVTLSNGGGSFTDTDTDTDTQQLSLSGNTLSLTNGGSVTLPSAFGDNLGNHTATTNLGLNGNWLSNAPGNSNGLRVDNAGNVGVGVASPAQRLDVEGGILARAHSPISNQGAYLQWNRTGGDGETWLLNQQGQGGTNAGIRFGSATTSNATTEWARFRNDGNFGIGTTNPAATLDVNGGLVLEETVSPDLTGSSPAFVIPANVSMVRLVPGTPAPTGTIALASTGPVVGQQLTVYNTTLLPANLSGQTLPANLASALVYSNGGWQLTGAATGDNLGDHVATQNLNLNGNKLVGGTTARAIRGGLSLNGNGLLTVGAARVNADSTTRYGVRLLNMDQDVVITSDQGKGNQTPAVTGAGDRMMWLSYYSAFRAGGVTDDRWNQTANNVQAIGQYSAAFGLDNQASSLYSSAFGWNNLLRNSEGTMVMGNNNNIVQSFYGVVMGARNSPKGWYNFVGGYQNKIRGSTQANYSASVGAYVPDWPPSFAFGQGCYSRSSRGNTYTMGYYARTAGYYGSFVFADMSPLADDPQGTTPSDRVQDSVYSTDYNQMTMRFAGGYRLFTTVATRTDPSGLSALGTPVGVQLFSGGNAWQTLSDSTKKERRVLADGNLFLARINRMRLGSWNYIGQSADTMRHYGPMAQDFYQAFGEDGVGRIGNKTSINQADFDGVNLIAIQALYRRVLLLEAENASQQQQMHQLLGPAASQPAAPTHRSRTARLTALRQENAALKKRAATAEAAVAADKAQATATLEAFEARLRRLEAATGGQVQR